MSRKPGAVIRTKKYHRFRGVDFSTDPALVDDTRSPWAPNLVSDMGGMPEKRPGWRTLARFEGRINGLFHAEFDGVRHLLVHAGAKLYRWYGDGTGPEDPGEAEREGTEPEGTEPEGTEPGKAGETESGEAGGAETGGAETDEPETDGAETDGAETDEPETNDTQLEELADGLPDQRSTAVFLNGKLWIFTGARLLRYDGETCADASDGAYVPMTVISSDPGGGGTAHEAVNLLTGKQKIGYLADGTSRVYKLPYQDLESVDTVEVEGKEMSAGYTADLAAGTVTFQAAPARPAAGAADNVFITFTKTIDGYAERIGKCTVAFVWGANGGSDRIVAAGNPDFPNRDFTCGYEDGSYWPDTGYAVVGSEETAIIGYRRLGEYLAVIKEDNGQDSTVFIRSGTVDMNGKADFFVKPCLTGAGAVSRFGFGSIGDEQLILTGAGVYALTTNSLTAERIVQNRSARVDPKLLREELSEAVSCGYNGAYLVFVGGHVYGLDGRQPKSYSGNGDTGFLYECFYWENVPARCVMRLIDAPGESLYFGTEDGRVCRFNTDIADLTRYSDDGAAVEAVWSTRADDDGDPMVRKTMLIRGNAVTIKPYARSGAKILLRTDADAVAWQAAEGIMDIFDWEDIDFSRFTFVSNDAPQEIPFRCKVRNYTRLQILVKNDAVNEGFGVYGIVKHFAFGGFEKGR